tara:strand:+ start:197 stop:334 length:138 start_codon:yes stop_codon:yes gene_type:complete
MIKIIKRTLRVTKNKKDIKIILDYVNRLRTKNIISDTEYNYILNK